MVKTFNKEFGEKVKEFRKNRHYSQRLAAKKMGMDYGNLSKVERGARPVGLQTALVIADGLRLNASEREELLDLIENKKPQGGYEHIDRMRFQIVSLLNQMKIAVDDIQDIDSGRDIPSGRVFSVKLKSGGDCHLMMVVSK